MTMAHAKADPVTTILNQVKAGKMQFDPSGLSEDEATRLKAQLTAQGYSTSRHEGGRKGFLVTVRKRC